MNLELNPRQVLKAFSCIIIFFLCANIAGLLATFYIDNIYVDDVSKLFNLRNERSIPTLYSSIALFLASILLMLIAQAHKKSQNPYMQWAILAIIFLFLSIDEASSIHEELVAPMRRIFGATGFFYYAWIIPYAIFLLGFVIAYSKFLLKLPKQIMVLFIVSGAIFVLGAIGFEMLGGRHDELYGGSDAIYAMLYTCEEFLEMLGVVIFIYALLTYITTQFNGLKITITK